MGLLQKMKQYRWTGTLSVPEDVQDYPVDGELQQLINVTSECDGSWPTPPDEIGVSIQANIDLCHTDGDLFSSTHGFTQSKKQEFITKTIEFLNTLEEPDVIDAYETIKDIFGMPDEN